MITIADAINNYLHTISLARSENTVRTYQNGLNVFKSCLEEQSIDIDKENCDTLTEKHFSTLIYNLKIYSANGQEIW